MGKRFVDRLKAGEILIADGATATNYQQMGMAIGVAPEEWTFDQPKNVRGLHRAFIEAGSDIILTNTFGARSLRCAIRGTRGARPTSIGPPWDWPARRPWQLPASLWPARWARPAC